MGQNLNLIKNLGLVLSFQVEAEEKYPIFQSYCGVSSRSFSLRYCNSFMSDITMKCFNLSTIHFFSSSGHFSTSSFPMFFSWDGTIEPSITMRLCQ